MPEVIKPEEIKTFTLADLVGKTVRIESFKGEEGYLFFAVEVGVETNTIYILRESK
jgi:hypothetical protein